jgi:uroporphyrinogen decarboxylase
VGVDVINPVQVTCVGMDTATLKRQFGKELGFRGGFVFTPVHNIMPNVPVENVAAACDEARRSGVYPVGA